MYLNGKLFWFRKRDKKNRAKNYSEPQKFAMDLRLPNFHRSAKWRTQLLHGNHFLIAWLESGWCNERKSLKSLNFLVYWTSDYFLGYFKGFGAYGIVKYQFSFLGSRVGLLIWWFLIFIPFNRKWTTFSKPTEIFLFKRK